MNPLTPPHCDLQDFEFMPLHVARLRDSDMAGEESPEACWYALLLWAVSWHQLPAGSLPNNDTVLTKLLGLGKDVKTFRKHRAGAMRGFVLCDDGRFYHPVVAEIVTEAWTRKLEQRWRTECSRIAKRNQRDNTDLQKPSFEAFCASLSNGHGAPCPEVVLEDIDLCPQGQRLQGTGTGTGTGILEAAADGRGASDQLWVERLAEVTELAGAGVDLTSGAVHAYSDLRRLCEPASGEPCTWDDVRDAVRAEAASAIKRKSPIRSWAWIDRRAFANRDRRLAGAPSVADCATLAKGHAAPSIADRIGAENAEARRRAFAEMDANHG